MLRPQDIPIWQQAREHLNVRSNDEHTLIAYVLAQNLLEKYPRGNPDIVLPAILLHDTGWSKIPKDKILQAFGPNNKYPELTRQHEIEGVIIAESTLQQLDFPKKQIEKITSLIDGHDTTKNARSINDSLLKDADKLWRYTPHGVITIEGWFHIPTIEVLDILENFVLPTFLTDFGRENAKTMLKTARMSDELGKWLN